MSLPRPWRGPFVILLVAVAGYVLGSISRGLLLPGLSAAQQVWALFAIGLLGAIGMLYRAARAEGATEPIRFHIRRSDRTR